MNARALVADLGGRWCGSFGMARCPAHADRSPSLKIFDGDDDGVVVHCFAGCDWRDVKHALHRRDLLPAWEPPSRAEDTMPRTAPTTKPRERDIDVDTRRRIETARAIWTAACPIAGSTAERYLRNRAVQLRPWPATIRSRPGLWHRESGREWPALICAVACWPNRSVQAVQAIYLDAATTKKAIISPNKKTFGPIRGAAVRFCPPGSEIGLAEGVETGLSVQQLYGGSVWCTLGGANLRNVVLPDLVEHVVIFGDSGDAGHRFAERAAETFHHQGRKVELAFPVKPYGDFNDVLVANLKERVA